MKEGWTATTRRGRRKNDDGSHKKKNIRRRSSRLRWIGTKLSFSCLMPRSSDPLKAHRWVDSTLIRCYLFCWRRWWRCCSVKTAQRSLNPFLEPRKKHLLLFLYLLTFEKSAVNGTCENINRHINFSCFSFSQSRGVECNLLYCAVSPLPSNSYYTTFNFHSSRHHLFVFSFFLTWFDGGTGFEDICLIRIHSSWAVKKSVLHADTLWRGKDDKRDRIAVVVAHISLIRLRRKRHAIH